MKRITLIAIFIILTIAACRPISRGPNPYQAPSPLAMSMESPLYARGALPTLPDGMIATDDEQRSGTIPVILPVMRYKLYAPILMHQRRYPCFTNQEAAELLRLMIDDHAQQRKSPRCDELVTKVAQMRADDMVTRNYFGHITPEGHGANFYLAQVGCLPTWYPQDGNTVESITLNYHTPQAAWNALVSSKGHRPHVLGMHPFFAAQVAIGVGYAEGGWGEVFVIVSTEGCGE